MDYITLLTCVVVDYFYLQKNWRREKMAKQNGTREKMRELRRSATTKTKSDVRKKAKISRPFGKKR